MTSGSIDTEQNNHQLSAGRRRNLHLLRLTVVLTDGRSGRNIILDLVKRTNPGSIQIHDRTTRLDQMSLSLGTSGKTIPEELFVFADEVLELTFLGGQCVELVDVELSELFDVNRSAVLRACDERGQSVTRIGLWETMSLTLSVRW